MSNFGLMAQNAEWNLSDSLSSKIGVEWQNIFNDDGIPENPDLKGLKFKMFSGSFEEIPNGIENNIVGSANSERKVRNKMHEGKNWIFNQKSNHLKINIMVNGILKSFTFHVFGLFSTEMSIQDIVTGETYKFIRVQ